MLRKKLLFLFASILCFASCKNDKNNDLLHESRKDARPNAYYEQYLREISFLEPKEDSLSTAGMVKIPGGSFIMGGNNEQSRENEFPRHEEKITELWVDETEVTNAQFQEFVDATGYVTTAERSFEYGGKKYPPGAMVFDPENPNWWWKFVEGAYWKKPEGPGSNIEGKEDLPVVQVSWFDAMAYAKWAGKRLPTEAEYEYINRGTSRDSTYHWGNKIDSAYQYVNYFQGNFPEYNSKEDGYLKMAPVKSFKPNDYQVYDISGNVWEWCLDTYFPDAYSKLSLREDGYFQEYSRFDQQKVIRGGSYLCSESYCSGYRNSARMSSSPEAGMEHIGFRCVREL